MLFQPIFRRFLAVALFGGFFSEEFRIRSLPHRTRPIITLAANLTTFRLAVIYFRFLPPAPLWGRSGKAFYLGRGPPGRGLVFIYRRMIAGYSTALLISPSDNSFAFFHPPLAAVFPKAFPNPTG